METKHSTKYEVRKGSIELWSSSIRVIDESGDTVEIDFPYTAFRDALKNFVVHSLSQSTQEELIELMTAAASVWLFFYQPPGAERSSFSHSGTQPYVRVVR
jgi:hypothetical protein